MPDDLNSHIRDWRRSLGHLSEPQKDELEDHLREQLAELDGLGLTETEAFTIAAMRCGKPSELSLEFARADRAAVWSRRLMWMVAGYLVVYLMNFLVFVPTRNLGVLGLQQLGVPQPWVIALSVLGVSAIVGLILAVAIPGATRRLNRGGGTPRRDASGYGWRPIAIGLVAALIMLPWLAEAVEAGWNMLLIQTSSVEAMGNFALASTVTSLIVPFAAPLTLWILACVLHKNASA